MKKIIISGTVLATLLVVSIANAQLFVYNGSSTVTSTAMTTSSSSSLPTPVVALPTSTVMPTVTATAPITTGASGFVQFNGLVVQSVSAAIAPSTIVAVNPTTCESFATEFATTGTMMACPTTQSSTLAITISATTQLLLSDRTGASLANITAGDNVNVFGYYDGNGNIQAQVVRDLSKPAIVAGASTTAVNGSQPADITAIETEIAQIQTVLAQLIQEIQTMSAATTTTSATTSASGPMIPYTGSSTPVATSTTTSTMITGTSTIIY